jgi:hypothetical protein
VYDVAEVASGPITASGDNITVQLIQRTDSRSVIMIVWPVVVGKFLILEAGVDRSYLVAAPIHGRSAEADFKAAPGAAAVSRLGANEPSGQRFVTQWSKPWPNSALLCSQDMRVVARASIELARVKRAGGCDRP